MPTDDSSISPSWPGYAAGGTVVLFLAAAFGNAWWTARVRDRGYDFVEQLGRATAYARNTVSDVELRSFHARYVDDTGRIRLFGGSRRNGREVGFTYTFRSPSRAAIATPTAVLGGPRMSGTSRKCLLQVEISPANSRLFADGMALLQSDEDDKTCGASNPAPPRCTLAGVWQEAKKVGAPHPAMAEITLSTGDGGRRVWRFSIVDRGSPTNDVVFKKELPDDCATR